MNANRHETRATPLGRRSEHGSALVMVLLLAAILFVLGGTYLAVSVTDRRIASNEAAGTVAFNLAEAGLEHAIAELPDQNANTLLASGGLLFNGTALGEGTYTARIANNIGPDFPTGLVPADPGGATNDTDGYLVVTSTGAFQGARRTTRVIVRFGSSFNPFMWAAFGDQKWKTTGSADTYGPAGTNAKMEFSGGGPKVYGDAQAVLTIQDPGTYVTGTATEGAAPVPLPTIACPTTAYGPAPTGPGFTFDAASGKLSIGGDTHFPAGTYYFSEISKSGGNKITIPNGGKVEIFIDKKVQMSGGGWNNPNNAAENLVLWGCGTDTSGWTITGPQESWMAVYAPTHKIKFTGEGNKNGSFIGLEFENSGPGNVIYDNALKSAFTTGAGAVAGTWSEVW